jgi:hypothetical protein
MTRVLIAVLLLAACTDEPTYQVGDCIAYVYRHRESWQPRHLEKIMEIGQHAYRTRFVHALDGRDWTVTFWSAAHDYEPVECKP